MAGTGRLIAICGIDGSGKTTQAELLVRRLESEGRGVRLISFPRYGEGFFADLIERYLRGEFAARASDVNPCLAALPYALDRWQAAPQLRKWLAEGAVVLCNRYVPANMAHQGSKVEPRQRRAFFRWVDELEYGALALPRPDAHVLLDMPPEHAAQLARERGSHGGVSSEQDIHESDLGHLEATAKAYGQIAELDAARWHVVGCVEAGGLLPPERIAERVWSAVSLVL